MSKSPVESLTLKIFYRINPWVQINHN